MSQSAQGVFTQIIKEIVDAYPNQKVSSESPKSSGNGKFLLTIEDQFGQVVFAMRDGGVIFQHVIYGFKDDFQEIAIILHGERKDANPFDWQIFEINPAKASSQYIRPASNILDRHSNYAITQAIRQKATDMLNAWPEAPATN